METKPVSKTTSLAMTAVMSAVICVLSPFAIPIGPVPITLSVFAILLAVYVLGWKRGSVSCLVYILLGMVGAPVFSNFSGGLSKLAGPTGGYIVGYIPMAIVAGLILERWDSRVVQALGMALSVAVLYAFGTVWFCMLTGKTVAAALAVCVTPFIPGSVVKIAGVLIVGPMICAGLKAANIDPRA
ncbi:MAG: biotin transporter BioY [Lawsonibacter sp.]|nr:biotin transporter BioY [Lawsonibacter sp.]